jgi:hypothetical protein
MLVPPERAKGVATPNRVVDEEDQNVALARFARIQQIELLFNDVSNIAVIRPTPERVVELLELAAGTISKLGFGTRLKFAGKD